VGGSNPGSGADIGLHPGPDQPVGPTEDGVTGPETGRTGHRNADFARIVDNTTDIMYPNSGWIPLLVCVLPLSNHEPRPPSSLRAGVRHFRTNVRIVHP